MFFLVLLAWFFVTSLELLQSFGIFFLQNAEVDLYTDILELVIFWLKNRGSTYTQVRLIHWKICNDLEIIHNGTNALFIFADDGTIKLYCCFPCN